MAIDPATAKAIAKIAISQITDEEKRQRLIIGIIIGVVVLVFIIMIPLFALTETLDNIKSFFGFGDNGEALDKDYTSIVEMRNNAGLTLNTGDLTFDGGIFPLPVENPIVTCEFGPRVHPVTKKQSFHTGIDLAGKWHSNIMAVKDGIVAFAGVQRGYGNCVEIEHKKEETIFYTFYGHLARIDVIKGQEILQGNIIGIQGGDPNKDPNPGYSTGSHLHFEIRKSLNSDFLNPREYLFERKEEKW